MEDCNISIYNTTCEMQQKTFYLKTTGNNNCEIPLSFEGKGIFIVRIWGGNQFSGHSSFIKEQVDYLVNSN